MTRRSPLGMLSAPFGMLIAPLGMLSVPFGMLSASFGMLSAPLGMLIASFGMLSAPLGMLIASLGMLNSPLGCLWDEIMHQFMTIDIDTGEIGCSKVTKELKLLAEYCLHRPLL